MSWFYSFDITLFQWINAAAGISPALDALIIFCAVYLIFIISLAVAGYALVTFLPRLRSCLRERMHLFTMVFASAFVARVIIAQPLRWLFARPRPFETLEGIQQLINHNGGESFPSGHASFSFAMATAVSFFSPRAGVVVFIFAAITSLARVAAGVHFPSDIAAGAAIGAGSAFLVRWIAALIQKRSIVAIEK